MITRRTILQLLGVATAATAVPPVALAAASAPPPPPEPAPALLPARITKLELFIRSRGIKPAHLARESVYARAHLLRIRMGRVAASAACALAITSALRRLAREPVEVADLFDHVIVLSLARD